METFNPGYCTIEKAELSTYDGVGEDITGIIGTFVLQQSMDKGTYTGSIEVLDSVGLLVNLPIRGEETLKIKLRCHDLQTVVDLVTQVVSISDVEVGGKGGDKYTYSINFISKASYEASKANVITAFSNKTASFGAEKIFNKYFKPNMSSGRKFNLEQSYGAGRFVIPDYSPAKAMKFLAAKAYSNRSKSATYRFFETIEGYNWVTDEWLLEEAQKKDIKNLKYSPIIDRNPLQGAVIIETLETFNNSAHVNTLKDMDSGAYKNTVMEIDLVTHKKTVFNYDYLKQKKKYKSMSGKVGGVAGLKHSEKFINETFTYENSPQHVVYRDWNPRDFQVKPGQVPRDEQYMTDIIQNRSAYHYHLVNNMCSATMKGRLDLKPGEVVNLSVVEPDAALEGKQNKRLSGYYLIYSTAHNINGSELSTGLNMIKFNWDTEQ